MKYIKTLCCIALVALSVSVSAHAGVYSSDQVIQSEQFNFDKQQVINMIDEASVQEQLIALGVNKEDALVRLNAMTPHEINALNQQLNDAPAGGIIGTVVTVLVVVAVLDLMGITDVYPFIRPI